MWVIGKAGGKCSKILERIVRMERKIQEGGPDALRSHSRSPRRFWNKLPESVRAIIKIAILKIVSIDILLRLFTFTHSDIGCLNKIKEIDWFIISIPKCGTTSLAQGLRKFNKHLIQTHTNEKTYRALTNGHLLRAKKVGMEDFIRYRLKKIPKEIFVCSGFRESISWYLSLAYHRNIPLDNNLRKFIVDNMGDAESAWGHAFHQKRMGE